MTKSKLLKLIFILAFLIITGVFYSCKKNKPDTFITLQNQEDSNSNQERDYNLDAEETTKVIDNTSNNNTSDNKDTGGEPCEYIYVHICGAVMKPDVYKVLKDTRLIDVIKLAGGVTLDAAGDYVNQASIVKDGQQIYIPTKDEVKGQILSNGVMESDMKPSKVNINTATLDELMTLTGIGESKAKSIIAYREKYNGFNAIEDIKNIDGIKDSVFNKICDMITVN